MPSVQLLPAMQSKANLFLLQAKKAISYAESDNDDDEDAFDPAGISTKKKTMRNKRVVEDDDEEDEFIGTLDGAADDDGGYTEILVKILY